ncbi:MAG: tryptophan synthase subunit alpha [Euryarchaeota archaeon RBG_19FT_COMBO_56_21]|nr:MAG: tryptophan synthase subunit alpha [Euryarchaeota archaeon RBG_19FT_COMBO_56_21]
MSRIEKAFRAVLSKGDGAFIAYVCTGDPDPHFTIEQAVRLSDAGADILELGIPFSDPVADGPVIQGAMNRALSGGFATEHIFHVLRSVRRRGVSKPIVIMTYYNPILQYGPDRFCKAAADSGADGLLVVDLPPEESAELDGLAISHGLDVIRLVAPSTSSKRLEHILSGASGFVYAVSVAGTTGARSELPSSAEELVKRVVSMTKLPVALGFGISTPEHVRAALSMGAAGVVEGSGLIAAYSSALPQRPDALDSIERHAREMKRATLRGTVTRQSAQR